MMDLISSCCYFPTSLTLDSGEFVSSELLMCGGGVHSILLLPLVARCPETMDVCIWRMFDFMSVVWGSVGIFVVQSMLCVCVEG